MRVVSSAFLFFIFAVSANSKEMKVEWISPHFYQLRIRQEIKFAGTSIEVKINKDPFRIRNIVDINKLQAGFPLAGLNFKFGKIHQDLSQTFEINPGVVVNPLDYTEVLRPEPIGVWGGEMSLERDNYSFVLIANKFQPIIWPHPEAPWYPVSLKGLTLAEVPKKLSLTGYWQAYLGPISHWLVFQTGRSPYPPFEKQVLAGSLGNTSLPLNLALRWEIVGIKPKISDEYLVGVVALERHWFLKSFEITGVLQTSLAFGERKNPLNWRYLFDRHLGGQVLISKGATEIEIQWLTKPGREHYGHAELRQPIGNRFVGGVRLIVLGGENDSFFGSLNQKTGIQVSLTYFK